MPHQPDYSDSDDESIHEELETGVLLGLPDGFISSKTDLFDPAVSRMGGVPTFLPSTSIPPPDISHCKSCYDPMELLIQVWCPFEQSPMDRMLYVWGCSRAGCQRKDGSVRAYRSVKFNARFAAKLERQNQKAKEKEEAKRREREEDEAKMKAATPAAKPNPFSLSSAPSNSAFASPFGSGNLFASSSAPAPKVGEKEEEEEDEDSDDDEPPATEDEINELAEALESSALDSEPQSSTSKAHAVAWASVPSFKPLYLSSVSEYLVPEAKPKQTLKNVKVSDGLDEAGGGGGGGKWKTETYEKDSNVDEIFSRFSKRVVNEGKQCLR
ncbi:hypothetical protein FRB90_010560, partial [Tulasnella sp. 427]